MSVWLFYRELLLFDSVLPTLEAEVGDVFVIPAGIAHKTYNTKPEACFKLLSAGSAHGIEASDPRKSLSEIDLDGYTMMGAYNGGDWDFVQRGGVFEKSWVVPKPSLDPVFGDGEQGLVKAWAGNGETALGRKVAFKDGIAVMNYMWSYSVGKWQGREFNQCPQYQALSF